MGGDIIDIINNINKALKRMEIKGYKNSEHYNNLKNKRDAILNGIEYKITSISEELIGGVASLIPNVNMNYKNERIKPKGNYKITNNAQKIIDIIHNVYNDKRG